MTHQRVRSWHRAARPCSTLRRRLPMKRFSMSDNGGADKPELLASSPFRASAIMAMFTPTKLSATPIIPIIIPGTIYDQYLSGRSASANSIAPTAIRTLKMSTTVRLTYRSAVTRRIYLTGDKQNAPGDVGSNKAGEYSSCSSSDGCTKSILLYTFGTEVMDLWPTKRECMHCSTNR